MVPIASNRAHFLAGFLVAGISPRLALDDSYMDFLNLVSAQISTSIATARDHEQEQERMDALAEIDRAKTTFLSNLSHEFRTPLTLLLSPLKRRWTTDHRLLSRRSASGSGRRIVTACGSSSSSTACLTSLASTPAAPWLRRSRSISRP